MTSSSHAVHTPTFDVDLALTEQGSGPAVLVLHGGGGPGTVTALASHLAETNHRAIVPTNPGWEGTPRPGGLATVADLAGAYLQLLADLDLTDVTVIGSSMGGWVAAEMVLQAAASGVGRAAASGYGAGGAHPGEAAGGGGTDEAQDARGRVGALVIIDGAGILPAGYEFADITGLSPRAFAELNWHDPDRFFVDPSTLPPERVAQQRANIAAMMAIAGDPYMHDPALLGRLRGVTVPSLLVWGDSDGTFTPDYGRAYAAAIPGARFELIGDAGHLPHLERPAETAAVLDSFLAGL